MVTALAWPMKKKLDWLKMKFKVASNELHLVRRNLGDVQSVVDSLVAEREDVHRSLMSIGRDIRLHSSNSTAAISPKRATRRTLLMQNHSEAMQQLIEEHVTKEGLAVLKALQATEDELSKVTSTLQSQFERVEKANDKLEDAYNVLVASKSIAEEDNATTVDLLSNQHSVCSTELQEIVNNSEFGGNSYFVQRDVEQLHPLSAPHTQADYTSDTSFSPDPFLSKLKEINNINNSVSNHDHNMSRPSSIHVRGDVLTSSLLISLLPTSLHRENRDTSPKVKTPHSRNKSPLQHINFKENDPKFAIKNTYPPRQKSQPEKNNLEALPIKVI